RFFVGLFARIQELRAHTGRPHMLIVDEAHHVLPAHWQPAETALPERLDGVLLISVTPSLIATPIVRAVHTIIVLGDDPQRMLDEFTQAAGQGPVRSPRPRLEPGHALVWNRADEPAPLEIVLEPSKTERRRHLRKYAE